MSRIAKINFSLFSPGGQDGKADSKEVVFIDKLEELYVTLCHFSKMVIGQKDCYLNFTFH